MCTDAKAVSKSTTINKFPKPLTAGTGSANVSQEQFAFYFLGKVLQIAAVPRRLQLLEDTRSDIKAWIATVRFAVPTNSKAIAVQPRCLECLGRSVSDLRSFATIEALPDNGSRRARDQVRQKDWVSTNVGSESTHPSCSEKAASSTSQRGNLDRQLPQYFNIRLGRFA
jgi:hypothetical protein